MAIGKATDFVIYQEQYLAGVWEAMTQNVNAFNGASQNYNGFGRNASDNNSLFIYAWFAY